MVCLKINKIDLSQVLSQNVFSIIEPTLDVYRIVFENPIQFDEKTYDELTKNLSLIDGYDQRLDDGRILSVDRFEDDEGNAYEFTYFKENGMIELVELKIEGEHFYINDYEFTTVLDKADFKIVLENNEVKLTPIQPLVLDSGEWEDFISGTITLTVSSSQFEFIYAKEYELVLTPDDWCPLRIKVYEIGRDRVVKSMTFVDERKTSSAQ